jgi:uncharacterized protein (TIGR00255 family)
MTGFGEGTARRGETEVSVTLSSVNRKQLDIALQIPRELAVLEAGLSELIRGQFSRGKIYGQVRVQNTAEENTELVIDGTMANQAVELLRKTGSRLHLSGELTVSDLLRIPGLFRMEKPLPDPEKTGKIIEAALKKALRELTRMRAEEGRKLAEDLQERLGRLEDLRAAIEKEAPHTVEFYRKKLFDRLKKLGLEKPEEDERILREIALFAERCDISEELIRIASHLSQARKLLRSSQPAGRTLDFLCQELFREINTIGSKANNLAVTRRVLSFKTELERIREQVQNIE